MPGAARPVAWAAAARDAAGRGRRGDGDGDGAGAGATRDALWRLFLLKLAEDSRPIDHALEQAQRAAPGAGDAAVVAGPGRRQAAWRP